MVTLMLDGSQYSFLNFVLSDTVREKGKGKKKKAGDEVGHMLLTLLLAWWLVVSRKFIVS